MFISITSKLLLGVASEALQFIINKYTPTFIADFSSLGVLGGQRLIDSGGVCVCVWEGKILPKMVQRVLHLGGC